MAEAIAGLLGVTNSLVVARVHRVTLKVSGGDKGLAEALASDVSMKKPEMDQISKLSGLICQRWNILGMYAPELLLGVYLVNYGARVGITMKKLSQLEARQDAERAKATKANDAATPSVLQTPGDGAKRDG